MSCSNYNRPAPSAYSNYPETQKSFYSDPYNNLSHQTPQQQMQLNLSNLMPASWNAKSESQARSLDPKDDWSRYTVTRDGVQRYISASGANRISQIDRSPLGSKVGQPNLLRSQPPSALRSTDSKHVIFNDSGFRQALVDPSMHPWIGDGQ